MEDLRTMDKVRVHNRNAFFNYLQEIKLLEQKKKDLKEIEAQVEKMDKAIEALEESHRDDLSLVEGLLCDQDEKYVELARKMFDLRLAINLSERRLILFEQDAYFED